MTSYKPIYKKNGRIELPYFCPACGQACESWQKAIAHKDNNSRCLTLYVKRQRGYWI